LLSKILYGVYLGYVVFCFWWGGRGSPSCFFLYLFI